MCTVSTDNQDAELLQNSKVGRSGAGRRKDGENKGFPDQPASLEFYARSTCMCWFKVLKNALKLFGSIDCKSYLCLGFVNEKMCICVFCDGGNLKCICESDSIIGFKLLMMLWLRKWRLCPGTPSPSPFYVWLTPGQRRARLQSASSIKGENRMTRF